MRMRNYRSLLFTLIICLIIAPSSLARPLPLTSPDKLRYPALDFKPPQAERVVLENGLIVYILEDHELPLVNIYSITKTGGYFDPEGKEGLAELTGKIMRTGGTRNSSGSAIDETLESLAINISVAAQMESCTVGFSSLKNNLEKGVEIFSQIMMRPVFADDKLQLAKNLKMEELRRISDDAQQFAFREFNRVLYRGNPRGRLASLASVERITRLDLQQFHQRHFIPDNTMMAITGDITKNEALALLKKHFGHWQKKGIKFEIPPPATKLKSAVYYLPKNVPQSVIVTGTFAPAKNHADFFPFTVLDFILGSGGFRSHIFQEIRTNQGLAYSAGSFYRARGNYGVFGTYAMTKSATTGKVLSLLRSISEKARQAPFRAAEVALAKKSINNSFIFSFSSPEQIAKQQLMLEFDRLPKNYLEKYQDNIGRVTSEELLKVGRHYLNSGETVTLVMGSDKDFDQALSSFGTVEKLQVNND